MQETERTLSPAPRAGEKVSRKARTVNAFIRTLFLVCIIKNQRDYTSMK